MYNVILYIVFAILFIAFTVRTIRAWNREMWHLHKKLARMEIKHSKEMRVYYLGGQFEYNGDTYDVTLKPSRVSGLVPIHIEFIKGTSYLHFRSLVKFPGEWK